MFKNVNIAEQITRARKTNEPIKHRAELPKLSDLALQVVSDNFLLYPELSNLDEKYKNKVYEKITVNYPFEITFPLINYDLYWKKACNEHFKGIDFHSHGNCWKQAYAENYMKDFITNYDQETYDLSKIKNIFKIVKNYVFNLELPYYQMEFPFNLITSYFTNLTSLSIKYSPKLKKKRNILDKNPLLSRVNKYDEKEYGPINNEYLKFGIKIGDVKKLALSLKDMDYLLSLSLQGNFIDDELIGWFIGGFVSNQTIKYLDLSNNKITNNGVQKVCSLIYRSKTLTHVDLSYNQISGEGAFAISLILKENLNLKSLKLGMNNIDDINGSKILNALTKNQHLEELDLSENDLGHSSTYSLITLLKNNICLKILLLTNNNIFWNQELKESIDFSKSLSKLDLRNNKISENDLAYIDNVLVKKNVRNKLSKEEKKH